MAIAFSAEGLLKAGKSPPATLLQKRPDIYNKLVVIFRKSQVTPTDSVRIPKDGEMDSHDAARKVIEGIRAARNVDNLNGAQKDLNAEDLAIALRMLSEQLYSKPTHFILELIQNADDNTYPQGASPSLTLTYREDGYLWIGCNEVGFDEQNVHAICKIGPSDRSVEHIFE